MKGVDAAYYLIHSMEVAQGFEENRQAAKRFGAAARAEGVRRIIYLGGLGDRAGCGLRFGNRLIDSRSIRLAALPSA